jgi:hypothetical protein
VGKQIVPRKNPLVGLDFTSEDHNLPQEALRVARNCHVQSGVAVKRRGYSRLYKDRALRRGMLCQRAATEKPFHQRNVTGAVEPVVTVHSYPSLSHGFLQWHSDYQLTRAAAWAREFRLFTGKIDSLRNFFVFEQANDEDTGTSAQWVNICTVLSIYVSTAGRLVVQMRASTSATAWTAVRTFTSAATLTADTDYHVGLSYDGNATNGAGTLSLYINGVLDTAFAINWQAGELWHGETSRHTSYPNLVWLNQLYVQREMATDTADTATGAVPDDYYAEYPSVLEHGAESMGVYEIRFWNTAKNFAAVGYPLSRPLTAAEYGSGCVGYWPCWDGGGLTAENLVDVRRPIQLLPAEPASVPDSGFVSGHGLQISAGCVLFKYWLASDTQVDGTGRALSQLFGDSDRNGQNPGTVGCVEYTVNLRVRTPPAPKRRPVNAGSDPAQIGDDNYLLAVYMANPATPKNLFGQQMLTVRIPYGYAGVTSGSLYVQDNNVTTAAGAVLADDTVYSIWITRSRLGVVTVYLDNATSAYSTATVTSLTDVDFGLCMTIGAAFPSQPFRSSKNFNGLFRFEWLRVWNRVLTVRERQTFYNQALPDTSRSDNTLLINLEVKGPTGRELPSFCSYPTDFQLGQIYNSERLGAVSPSGGGASLTRQWWDAWPNSIPPYWGSYAALSTSYLPVGYEAGVESIGSHRSIFGGLSQMFFAAHGIAYVDRDFTRTTTPTPLVPARTSSYRTFWHYTSQASSRQVSAADRLLVLNDYGYPHIWNGRALIPLGIDLPAYRRMLNAVSITPAIVAGFTVVGGALVSGQFYSYKFVYVDEEFEVVGVIGPTVGADPGVAGTLIVGATGPSAADAENHADTANDCRRPIRCHLNPRVTGIRIFRSRGSATADLAEAGPFLYHSTFANADTTFIDGTADSALLPVQLDDSFDQPPAYRYADIFEGRLVLANTSLAKDAVLASASGLPEHFNLSNTILTEDGTGGVITGARSAFDSYWVFKTASIWRFVNGPDNIEGALFTSAIGCIAPHSLVEFYNQAAGRRMFFFWGPDGPYLFDGNQPVYIGQALKGPLSSEPFSAIKRDAITDIHADDISKLGEIWVWCKDPTTGEYTVCYAYDYITGAWLERTGLRFTALGRVDVPRDISTVGSADVIKLPTWIAGDQRGYLYELDKTTSDGMDDYVSPDDTQDVVISATSTVITCPTHVNWIGTLMGLSGIPLTLLHANGQIEVRWILSNTASTITVERAFTTTPVAGALFLLGGIGFHLEYVWDAADADTLDKLFTTLVTWHEGALYYRTAVDWAALSGAATLIADGDRKRVRTYINKFAEVLKLELTNYYPDQPVTIAARAWEISPTLPPVRTQ